MTAPHPPCPRCFSQAEVIRPWRGFKVIRNLWIAGLALSVCALPFVFMDMFVSIPALFIYAMAAGPVFRFAGEVPTCRSCGLARPHPGWHEKPIRSVPPAEVAGTEAIAHAVNAPRKQEEVSGLRRRP